MMAAAQPFLSGAISKTINMPAESTVEDIMQAYIESWKLGLKSVAIYRDNSKGSQPLSAAGDKKDTAQQGQIAAAKAALETVSGQQELFPGINRRKLPNERASITHKFSIGGHEGYLTVGIYDDTKLPGEIFIKMSKEGSTLSGFMDGFAISVSMALQYGVPLKALVDKFINTRFEPAGFTGNSAIPYARSVLDYLGRWLGGHFLSPDYVTHNGDPAAPVATLETSPAAPAAVVKVGDDLRSRSASPTPVFDGAPTCSECGMLMTPNGGCYKCENCGGTSGCS
jgi:ribonucleoside-diphosphate reductase alpha chain